MLIAAAVAATAVSVTFAGGSSVQETRSLPDAAELRAMTARFAPVDIAADASRLADSERRALGKLIEAARIMDALFLRQSWSGNDALLQHLSRKALEPGAADAQARLHYFLINKGPWSRLDHDRVFIPGAPAKPESANFYPAGASKEEVQKWLDSLSGEAKAQATGFFTTIRRGADGKFVSVPYSVEYQGELARAAALLREAVSFTGDATLKKYLSSRADAFISNDYYASDVAWMELDAAIEPTIGPYEVYEDEWFNYKAAFEAFITLRDEAESAKLQAFSKHLQALENALPIDPKYRNPSLGAMAPIRVVNVVFTAGDANRGVQTAAFNLPNDERVIREKGSKRVMLKNVQEAKFKTVLTPIAKVALAPADQARVSFDAFFTHILMHELMHGLGPHGITVGGRTTTVRQELKETYSAIEEAKADISGLWALKQLADAQQIDPAIARTMYTT
ncbi:MAG: dipeptidyl-peptidase 3 family protein, partial [Vicinamibacterales bacterium]